jgi:tetratricopeptide (TPR) repeat protein
LDPRFLQAHFFLGCCYLFVNRSGEALAEFKATQQLSPGWPWARAALGHVYGLSGRSIDARQVLADLDELARHRYVTRYAQAYVYLGLGEKTPALDCLENACEARDVAITFLKVDPVLASLQSEPRFRALLKRVGLVQ